MLSNCSIFRFKCITKLLTRLFGKISVSWKSCAYVGMGPDVPPSALLNFLFVRFRVWSHCRTIETLDYAKSPSDPTHKLHIVVS